jgi:hypothetical protein
MDAKHSPATLKRVAKQVRDILRWNSQPVDPIDCTGPKRMNVQVGQVIVKNGRQYRLNPHHRWQRADQQATPQQQAPATPQQPVQPVPAQAPQPAAPPTPQAASPAAPSPAPAQAPASMEQQAARQDMRKGFEGVAIRITQAENRFIEYAQETAGLSVDEAKAAMGKLKQVKALKIDPVGGQFTFTHGAYGDPDVLRRAAGRPEPAQTPAPTPAPTAPAPAPAAPEKPAKPAGAKTPRAPQVRVEAAGIQPDHVKLAATEGDTPAHREARQAVAGWYLRNRAMYYDPKSQTMKPLDAGRIAGMTDGIDYSKPVIFGPPPSIPPPMELVQWQAPGGYRGSYFSTPEHTPQELGIYERAVSWNHPDKPVLPRQKKVFDTRSAKFDRVTYLHTIAAPTVDTWSVPGQQIPVKGGGKQWFVPVAAHPGIRVPEKQQQAQQVRMSAITKESAIQRTVELLQQANDPAMNAVLQALQQGKPRAAAVILHRNYETPPNTEIADWCEMVYQLAAQDQPEQPAEQG